MTTRRKAVRKARKAAKRSTSTKKAMTGRRMSPKAALSTATSARKTVKQRVAAMAEVPMEVSQNDEGLRSLLDVLRNGAEPLKVRLAALQALQAANFSVNSFGSFRGEYFAALRKVAIDPDPELRQRVLGILARDKDGFAQKRLLEGLQHPDKALVSPEKALQLLSYDAHAEAYSIARDIVSKSIDEPAKRQALRLLASDATAAPIFEKVLRDKEEFAQNRQISASALQSLKPKRLQLHAREMLLDDSEYDDIQATSLTALAQFGDDDAVAKDEALLKSVDRLSSKASPSVKRSARRFLSKHRR